MANADNAKTTVETAVEIVSIQLVNRAHEAGVRADRRWVDEQLERLRSHVNGCRCSEACDLARMVSTSRVYSTVWGWQASIARTRRLAAR